MIGQNREKNLALAAGACFGLLLFNSVVINPLTTWWHNRSDEIGLLTENIRLGQPKLAPTLEKSVRAAAGDRRLNSLPLNISLAESKMMRAVDRWAEAATGLTISSRKHEWKQNPRDDEYVTLECHVDATGDMHSLVSFLYEMGKDPIAVNVEEVDIVSKDNSGQSLAMGLRFSGLQFVPTNSTSSATSK